MDYNYLKLHCNEPTQMDLFIRELKAKNPELDAIFFHLIHGDDGINTYPTDIKVVIKMKNGDRIDYIFHMVELTTAVLDHHEIITTKIIQLVQEYNESRVKNES